MLLERFLIPSPWSLLSGLNEKGGRNFSKETESNVDEVALLSKREVIRIDHLYETIIVFFQHASVRGRSTKEWGERGDTFTLRRTR